MIGSCSNHNQTAIDHDDQFLDRKNEVEKICMVKKDEDMLSLLDIIPEKKDYDGIGLQ